MLCRYKCRACGDFHPLANIKSRELMGAWIEFMNDPPEPFDRRIWDLLIRLEMRRRGMCL